MLPIEQGRQLQLPRHRHMCKLCHAGALGDERHLLLECPALADVRTQVSQLIAHCSGICGFIVDWKPILTYATFWLYNFCRLLLAGKYFAVDIMARLVWFKDQPLVSRYIMACLDTVSGH